MENLCLVRKLQMVYFYCGQKPSCNFFCPQNDCGYFETAIAMGRNSGTPQPKCHEHKKLAKIRVVKDILKPSFGRPFFVCSEKENPCSFWQWGDVSDRNATMVYNVRRVKLKKKVSTTAVCFMLVRREKIMRVAILSGEIL